VPADSLASAAPSHAAHQSLSALFRSVSGSNLCIGAIRVSFGATSTADDAARLLDLLRGKFLDGGPCPPVGGTVTPLTVGRLLVLPAGGAMGFEVSK